MFKREKITDDIWLDVENNLRKNAFQVETQKVNMKIEAMDLLNKAASQFESAGRIKESEAITRIVEFLGRPKVKQAQFEPEHEIVKTTEEDLPDTTTDTDLFVEEQIDPKNPNDISFDESDFEDEIDYDKREDMDQKYLDDIADLWNN